LDDDLAAGRDGGGKRHQARRPRLRQSAAVGLVEPRLWSRHRQGLASQRPSPSRSGGPAFGSPRPPPCYHPGRQAPSLTLPSALAALEPFRNSFPDPRSVRPRHRDDRLRAALPHIHGRGLRRDGAARALGSWQRFSADAPLARWPRGGGASPPQAGRRGSNYSAVISETWNAVAGEQQRTVEIDEIGVLRGPQGNGPA